MILVHAFIDKRFDGSAVPSSFAVNGNQNWSFSSIYIFFSPFILF